MWFIKNSTGDCYYLKSNQSVSLGRKNTDIILKNDESISRLHASILVQQKQVMEVNEPLSICEVKDLGSKYGTRIVGDKMISIPGTGYKLKNNDQIQFGLQHHIFTVSYVPIITVTSTLNNTEKKNLQCIMDEIDGLIHAEWISTCTHLTMSNATLTEKVTWALISAVPIVTMKYWEAVKLAFNLGLEMPNVDDFVPPISEELVNKEKVSLCRNEKRKTLFQNLIFVYFSTRQYKMYAKIIFLGGGKSVLYSKRPLSLKELLAPNVIVVQYPSSDATQSTQCIVPEYESIYNMLQTNKRRMILDYEIPLAILHCSVSNYANPKFNFSNLLKRSESRSKASETLALDTQDVQAVIKVEPDVPVKSAANEKYGKNRMVIPESIDTIGSIRVTDENIGSNSQRLQSSFKTNRNYIPETNDSFTSMASISGGNEAHNERPEQSKMSTKHIPETNDSCGNAIVEGNNEIAKSQLSNPQQKLGCTSIAAKNDQSDEKPTHVVKCENYIPETNDFCESNMEDNHLDSISQGSSSEQNDTSAVAERQINSKHSDLSTKTSKYIPETNDQASIAYVIQQKYTEISINRIENPKRKCPYTQKPMQIPIVVNETPDDVVIVNSMDNDFQSQNSQTNVGTTKKSCDNPIKKESYESSNVADVLCINVTDTDEVDEDSQKTVKRRKVNNTVSQVIAESPEKICSPRNVNTVRHDLDSDEEIPMPSNNSHDSTQQYFTKPPQAASSPLSNIQKDVSSFMNYTSSFLRKRPGFKQFKKVYCSIPKKRLTKNNMYVWSTSDPRQTSIQVSP